MQIFFTKRAETNYRDIKEYLTRKWGNSVTDVFEQKTADFLTLLKDFPELGTECIAEGYKMEKRTDSLDEINLDIIKRLRI